MIGPGREYDMVSLHSLRDAVVRIVRPAATSYLEAWRTSQGVRNYAPIAFPT